jgi:hypothetical protein
MKTPSSALLFARSKPCARSTLAIAAGARRYCEAPVAVHYAAVAGVLRRYAAQLAVVAAAQLVVVVAAGAVQPVVVVAAGVVRPAAGVAVPDGYC